ncbi:cTAGE family member 2-like [Artibeus jamaicensis]|uniref:cTAGE family member 2-like n=1 Tax=Artibeus jamaicensis TaxID=9417 RepID=UPI00235AFD3B|nr:cTAGE family member 2-like [Artibeus jamaicensis]
MAPAGQFRAECCGWGLRGNRATDQMERLWSSVGLGLGSVLGKLGKMVVQLLPSGLVPLLMVHVLLWKTLVCPPVLVGLVFIVRLLQSVWSRLYLRHEVQLAKAVATQVAKKCQLIEQVRSAREECSRLESALAEAGREKQSLNIPSLVDTYRKETTAYWVLRQEITSLVDQLKEERRRQSRHREEMAEMLMTLKALEEGVKTTTSRGAFPTLPGGQKVSHHPQLLPGQPLGV